MKKIFFFYVVLLFTVLDLYSFPIKDHTISDKSLGEIFDFFEINKNENIVKQTQNLWLRKKNAERWNQEELSNEKKVFVLNWAKENNFFDDWIPSLNTYDKVLIFGSTTPSMQSRLEFLIKLWEEGIKFNEIIWLTGMRPLDEKIDSFLDTCSNETQAAIKIWETKNLPEGIKKIPVKFISVEPRYENGVLKRPNTMDTIIAWINDNIQSGSYLFTSSQPHCLYQFEIVSSCLPSSYLFDVVGMKCSDVSAAVVLDSIARWLYVKNSNKFH